MALWDTVAQPTMYRGVAHTTNPRYVAMVWEYAKDVADISLGKHVIAFTSLGNAPSIPKRGIFCVMVKL